MSWFQRWTERRLYKWARGVAKAKLRTFRDLKKTHPEEPDEIIYYLAILPRLGYDDVIAKAIFDTAKYQAGLEGEEFKFYHIITGILLHEAPKLHGLENQMTLSYQMFRAIEDTIPKDL